jgi:predicted Zn-dependent peptidase
MPKYFLKNFKNDLKLFIIKTDKLSSIDITLYIKVGSTQENAKNNGISHLLEHVLYANTKNQEAFPNEIDIYPYTNKEFTYFETTAHKNLLEKTLLGLNYVVSSPDFEKNDLKIIKKEIILENEEYNSDSDSFVYFNQKIDESLYAKNTLALSIGGNKNSLKNISLEDLKKWYKKYYTSDNMILTIVGNVDIKKNSKLVNNIFNNTTFKKIAPKKTDKIKKVSYKKNSTIIKIKSNSQKRIYLASVFPIGGINDQSYFKKIILAEILSRKLRKKQKNNLLFREIELNFIHYFNTGEIRIINSYLKNSSKKYFLQIKDFLDSFKIEKDFFEDVKKYMINQFLLKNDKIDELSSLSLYLLSNKLKCLKLEDEIAELKKTNFNDIKKLKNNFITNDNCFNFEMN